LGLNLAFERNIWSGAIRFALLALYGCGQVASTNGSSESNDDLKNKSTTEASNSEKANDRKNEGVIQIDSAFDAKDERVLVGANNNVFIGQVENNLGTESTSKTDSGFPEISFAVTVEEVIKGLLRGKVTVVQYGGYEPAWKEDVVVEGDPLLRPGERVMFTTTNRLGDDPSEDTQIISAPPFGDVRIEYSRKKDKLVTRFKEAKKDQIPLESSKSRK